LNDHRLTASPSARAEAAAHLLAASSGVTLSVIQQPVSERDQSLSDRMRENVVAAITAGGGPTTTTAGGGSLRSAVRVLSTALEAATSALTAGERALMRELLARLADEPGSRRAGSRGAVQPDADNLAPPAS
jgi:hypothetical protein